LELTTKHDQVIKGKKTEKKIFFFFSPVFSTLSKAEIKMKARKERKRREREEKEKRKRRGKEEEKKRKRRGNKYEQMILRSQGTHLRRCGEWKRYLKVNEASPSKIVKLNYVN